MLAETAQNGAANSNSKRRQKGMPERLKPHAFKKGVSGNPNGRPKKNLDLAKLAQDMGEECIMTLGEVMRDKEAPPPARVNAAKELLDRGFGKARQDHKHEHTLTIAQEFEKFIRAANGDDARIIDGRVEEADTLLEG